jgi:hypothetical protein
VIAPYRQFSVVTVYSFQGQERDIIAITLTRSNPQGEIASCLTSAAERGHDPRTAQAAAGG